MFQQCTTLRTTFLQGAWFASSGSYHDGWSPVDYARGGARTNGINSCLIFQRRERN